MTLVGLSLAACITVAALLVLLLSHGDGPTLIVARWAPQPVAMSWRSNDGSSHKDAIARESLDIWIMPALAPRH